MIVREKLADLSAIANGRGLICTMHTDDKIVEYVKHYDWFTGVFEIDFGVVGGEIVVINKHA